MVSMYMGLQLSTTALATLSLLALLNAASELNGSSFVLGRLMSLSMRSLFRLRVVPDRVDLTNLTV